MKKTVISILCLIAVLTMLLSACSNKGGTVYPSAEEMKANLEGNGYTVNVTTDLGDKEGTCLYATKGEEYIVFYWLENSKDCDYFYRKLKKDYPNYNAAAEIENDKTFGNLVYCGTVTAVKDAGIKTLVIKSDVKV